MSDLGTQLRDHYDSVTVLIEPEDVIEGRVPITLHRRRRYPTLRTRVLAAATAAVLVLLLVGGVAWLVANRDDPIEPAEQTTLVTTPQTVPPTTAASPATSAPPVAAVIAYEAEGWQRHDLDPEVFSPGVFITEIIEWNGALIAVGAELQEGRDHPAAWFSSDGVSWVRAAQETEVSSAGVMTAVVPWSGGLVAVGSGRGSEGGQAPPRVWLSEDGTTWAEASVSIVGPSGLQDVAYFGDTLVAVGSIGETPLSRLPDLSLLWTSNDGVNWDPVNPSNVESIGDLMAEPKAVVAGPTGFVAAGTNVNGQSAAWFSPDGESWNAALSGLYSGYGSFWPWLHLAAGPAGYVAGYGDAFNEVLAATRAIAFSPDGVTWDFTLELEPGFEALGGVAAGTQGFVAVGASGDQGAIWTSRDGAEWTLVSGDGPLAAVPALSGVWAVGDQMIAFDRPCADCPESTAPPVAFWIWSSP